MRIRSTEPEAGRGKLRVHLELDRRNAGAWGNRYPRLAGAYCSRAAARLARGKTEEAEADFARCRSMGGSPKPEAKALLREMKARRTPK